MSYSYVDKVKIHPAGYKYKETEDVISEIEEFAKDIFENKNLKLGLKIHSSVKDLTLLEYLSNPGIAFAEIRVYFINDSSFDCMEHLVNHDKQRDNIFLGGFSLDEQRGCCSVCVFFGDFITVDYRDKKFGQYLMKLKKTIAKEKYYTIAICTNVLNNISQKKILKKFGFKSQFNFTSDKTFNEVELQSVDLNDERYYDVIWQKEVSTFQKYTLKVKKLLKKTYSMVTMTK